MPRTLGTGINMSASLSVHMVGMGGEGNMHTHMGGGAEQLSRSLNGLSMPRGAGAQVGMRSACGIHVLFRFGVEVLAFRCFFSGFRTKPILDDGV